MLFVESFAYLFVVFFSGIPLPRFFSVNISDSDKRLGPEIRSCNNVHVADEVKQQAVLINSGLGGRVFIGVW